MKVTASIVMYSGMPDPEMELSPEGSNEIIVKLNSVFDKSETEIKQGLGFRGYMVIWHGDELGVPYTAIRVHEGIIEIMSFASRVNMKDTAGLELYLKNLLAPTLQKHYDEAAASLATLYDELAAVSEKK